MSDNRQCRWSATAILILAGITASPSVALEHVAPTTRPTTAPGDNLLDLLSAISWSDYKKARALIRAGADVNVRDEHQNTPLYYAAVMGREEDFKLVKALIEHGANVNAVCQNRLTPLFQASMWGRLDVVEYLVAKGADVSAKNDGGDTPLHLAASTYVYSSSDIPAIVNFLLSHGASPWAKNDSGKLPIQLAKEPIPKGGRDYDKLVQQQREVITMLRHAMHRHDYQAN